MAAAQPRPRLRALEPLIDPTPTGIRLRVRVQPNAARTEVAGPYGEALRIRLAAPPVDGAANDALVRFLAERLGVPRAAVRIEHGHGGRSKVVAIDQIDPASAARRLLG